MAPARGSANRERERRAACRSRCERSSGCCRADRATCASSPPPWWSESAPMEIATGTDRWSWNPEHRPCWPAPYPGFRWHRPSSLGQSDGERTPRKCASRASRWRRPESIVGPARENPCDRVSTRAPTGKLRYRAGSLDRSVARTPSRGIARHSTAFGPGRRHRSRQQSAQKCSKAENPSAGRKAFCRCSRATPRKNSE